MPAIRIVKPFSCYCPGMCGGFEYRVRDPETGEWVSRKAFFPIPKVKVPVLDEGGNIAWARWGKRKGEDPDVDVPVTGWARLISLKEGRWNRYHPRRVRIPALRWMEKDGRKNSHWFDLPAEHCLLGVQIEAETGDGPERFVYIVTKPAEGVFADVHDRMPLIVATRPETQPV